MSGAIFEFVLCFGVFGFGVCVGLGAVCLGCGALVCGWFGAGLPGPFVSVGRFLCVLGRGLVVSLAALLRVEFIFLFHSNARGTHEIMCR